MTLPALVFASPRKLPRAADLVGRVVVLDLAFAADGLGKGFAKTTLAFINELGPRLACWVDHHDHREHARFRGDERFVLATKAQHGACPEMISPDLVARVGPIDTIVCHFDLDGLYAAAKWILGGVEPYPGADDDARAVDTRLGNVGPIALPIDFALRAGWEDEILKTRIVHYLVRKRPAGVEADTIAQAADRYKAMHRHAQELAKRFVIEDGVAVIHVDAGEAPYDKTDLLLMGQEMAKVAVVVDRANATFAAAFDSGINLLTLLKVDGGMPTRVSIPEKRLASGLKAVRASLASKG